MATNLLPVKNLTQ